MRRTQSPSQKAATRHRLHSLSMRVVLQPRQQADTSSRRFEIEASFSTAPAWPGLAARARSPTASWRVNNSGALRSPTETRRAAIAASSPISQPLALTALSLKLPSPPPAIVTALCCAQLPTPSHGLSTIKLSPASTCNLAPIALYALTGERPGREHLSRRGILASVASKMANIWKNEMFMMEGVDAESGVTVAGYLRHLGRCDKVKAAQSRTQGTIFAARVEDVDAIEDADDMDDEDMDDEDMDEDGLLAKRARPAAQPIGGLGAIVPGACTTPAHSCTPLSAAGGFGGQGGVSGALSTTPVTHAAPHPQLQGATVRYWHAASGLVVALRALQT
ncbi:hypothetical protein T492DRAFT_903573 [Pavlovales sp. CCMP2436]|nr:hypothetical protein T492DRAFT_903573 [Pavlovales sp. CCMP2436]